MNDQLINIVPEILVFRCSSGFLKDSWVFLFELREMRTSLDPILILMVNYSEYHFFEFDVCWKSLLTLIAEKKSAG